MANVKLSQLPELTTIPDDAVFYVVYNGVSYRVTKENLITANGGIPTLQQVTDQPNGTETTNPITVGGLTIADKINFITSLITAIRNVSWQDKDGTVAYLEDIENNLSGLKWKNPVVVAIDTAITMNGLLPQLTGTSIQGVTLAANDRVLLMNQANPAFNGCYRANLTISPGNVRFYRTTDSDTEAELVNALYPVTSGTYAEKTFRQTQSSITIGTTAISFDEFGSTVNQATALVAGVMKLYAGSGNNEDGTITQKAITDLLSEKLDKQLSAFSIYANNTNTAANGSVFTFRQVAKQTLAATVTITASAQPTGADHSYSWMQIGNMVNASITLHFTNTGTSVTLIRIDLPSDMPTPVIPNGLIGSSDRLYIGVASITASNTSTTPTQTSGFLRKTTSGFEFVIQQAAVNMKVSHLNITYFTT